MKCVKIWDIVSKMKERGKIMLDIKVGDFVKNNRNEVGYITVVYPDTNTFCHWQTTEGINMRIGWGCALEEYFERIGKYDFTKKNKIEPLTKHIIGDITLLPTETPMGFVIDKINEIINFINKE